MSYETAPATLLLATNCAICARPLVDSVSVETGIGPECRRKHGYNVEVSEDARAQGNAIVYRIAAERGTMSMTTLCWSITELRALGFDRLATVMSERTAQVVVTYEGDTLVVKAPYDANSTSSWRRVPGRRWDGERKLNTAPRASRAQVWALLRSFYPGRAVYCPDTNSLAVIPDGLDAISAAA